MNKYLKYGLWSIGGLVLLVASALAYVALTFDPNAYKPEIMQAVKNATQRTLKLDGDIECWRAFKTDHLCALNFDQAYLHRI